MPPSRIPTGPIPSSIPADPVVAAGTLAPLRRGWVACRTALASVARSQCRICDAWSAEVFCADCLTRHAAPRWRCSRCAIGLPALLAVHLENRSLAALETGQHMPEAICADCRRDPPAFDAAWAALDYGPPWDRLVAAFKFHGAPELARPLARLMLDRRPDADPAHTDPSTLLLPVPLTSERWRERGYNQAWELARRLGPALGLTVRDDLIERLVGGAHQVSLTGEARRHQVRGAYTVPGSARATLAGAQVVLVDDVMTTGATLAECARVLKRAGARRVTVWALARTPAD
ncbi:ComF family protein [Leptothrix discophora]|uniref:ComF family protein n=1 Tax=Leptothrix discophora TaxID=89 RepID=A0ABT9G7R2_LEPDI|nr:ComF family protein [Leptothrix discophora]MDP4302519.1 ComF family protein [Leptothrix discophora]